MGAAAAEAKVCCRRSSEDYIIDVLIRLVSVRVNLSAAAHNLSGYNVCARIHGMRAVHYICYCVHV